MGWLEKWIFGSIKPKIVNWIQNRALHLTTAEVTFIAKKLNIDPAVVQGVANEVVAVLVADVDHIL